MGTVSTCFVTAFILLFWAPSTWSGESVASAAYQRAQAYFAYYSKEHRELEHGTIGQPYRLLMATYKDILSAADARQLLSIVPVFRYEFPILVDGRVVQVIQIRPDPSTGKMYEDKWRGAGGHSVVCRLSQEMHPRELIRFHIDFAARSLIIVVNESGDTLITPCDEDGADILGMKAGRSGEFPFMSLNEAMPSLKAYAEELRAGFERWRK